MAVGDFLIPSVLEAFCDWPAPAVADDAMELLNLADPSWSPDERAAWIADVFDLLIEALEPALILLALTDHHVERIVVASSGGSVAPSVVPRHRHADRGDGAGAICPLPSPTRSPSPRP